MEMSCVRQHLVVGTKQTRALSPYCLPSLQLKLLNSCTMRLKGRANWSYWPWHRTANCRLSIGLVGQNEKFQQLVLVV